MIRFSIGLNLAIMLTVLAGCAKEQPAGQVVARVNGEEITIGELNHEAAARGISEADTPALRNQIIQDIVNRKLLVQSAKEKEVDRSRDFILQRQRAEELLLADLFIKSYTGSSNNPPSAEISEFVRANRSLFEQRTIFGVEQIGFADPGEPAVASRILAANTLDEIDQILAEAGVLRQRGRMSWDSALMPADLAKQLRALPANEPFVVPMGTTMVAGVIVEQRVVPLSERERQIVATEAVRQKSAQETMQSWLKSVRADAKIEYQKGFAPGARKAS